MPVFGLTIDLIEQVCRFRLSEGGQSKLSDSVPYPLAVTQAYEHWRRIYLTCYQAEQVLEEPELDERGSSLRARVESSGSVSPKTGDRRFQLREAESKFLEEFRSWLRRGELYEIRETIKQATRDTSGSFSTVVEVWITCSDELAYLPWEKWEIGDKFTRPGMIRFARVPDARASLAENQPQRRRPRVLTIWGDETGLDFDKDRKAFQPLRRVAEIDSVSYQPQEALSSFEKRLRQAIADEQGWDILFFTGHSAETELTGGCLTIAPQTTLSLDDLRPCLLTAKDYGLKLAIFNSCSGLSIARFLIGEIGLGQVIVMREPIHNQVAQTFLIQLLQNLIDHQDVHESLLAACNYLEQQRSHYPSAYLIPSLFRHPRAPLWRISERPPSLLARLLPNWKQGLFLAALFALGWSMPIQQGLMEQRMWLQAIYRQLTRQFPTTDPPVRLVQIDQESIRKAGITDPSPMDRQYIAKIIAQLTASQAKVVGIDYVFELPHGNSDRPLAEALKTGTHQKQTTFILAVDRDNGTGRWKEITSAVASPTGVLQGHIFLLPPYYLPFERPAIGGERLPFSQLLALADQLQKDPRYLPKSQHQKDLWDSINQSLRQQNKDYRSLLPDRAHIHPVTEVAYSLGQWWLNPILDFSLPPDRIYATIPAWELLEHPEKFPSLSQQVVILAPFYPEAGVNKPGEDNFSATAATRYWFRQKPISQFSTSISGGEIHAYATHHLLRNWLLLPIPDLWMMAGALLIGGGILLGQPQLYRHRILWGRCLVGLTGVYGLLSLQVYVSAAIVLPWVLPSTVLLVYILPKLHQRAT